MLIALTLATLATRLGLVWLARGEIQRATEARHLQRGRHVTVAAFAIVGALYG